MNTILDNLKNKIIVSVQAMPSEPLYKEDCIIAMVQSVLTGGACGLRLAGARDIKNVKKITDTPVIGITKPETLPKNWKNVVYITPSMKDVELLVEAGADIIAVDGTSRKRSDENLLQIMDGIKKLGKLSMADVATFEEGLMCRLLGADIISTTLSGYTTETEKKKSEKPDFELLKKLVKTLDCPIILEGRIWEPSEVKKAFEIGAHSVVIGSAITRPQLMTKRFVKAID
ncbi:MAG: N-acetylmannosamine-6-phosphate 2-epimerase [Candidatus Gastranaerophilaceae bacterium]|jgi:N-acylglucosamine-6-phosphate 2-epimerase